VSASPFVARNQSDPKKSIAFEKKEEWILILNNRIGQDLHRIVRTMRPSAETSLAAGEKIPDNPVDPV
jgi:hypothetical protein